MSHRYPFVRPIYRGQRFEDHAIPLDCLADLAAYQDLVIEVARELHRRKFPNRKRLPKNFAENFHLALHGVSEGSAIPCVDRIVASPQRPLLSATDVFDDARDVIARCLQAASRGEEVPGEFPRDLLWRFNHIGQALRDSESVEWCSGDATEGPRFDRDTRKRLILTVDRTWRQKVDLVGRIVAWDEERARVEMRLVESHRVPVYVGTDHMGTVRQLLATPDAYARVVGEGEFDASDRLKLVTRVHRLDPVSSEVDPDVDARLGELRQLTEGWLDGEGLAPSEALLDRVQRALAALIQREGLRPPWLYPTPDGGVRAEWSFDGFEVSADFERDHDAVWLHAAATRASFFEEKTVRTDELTAIASFIQRFDTRRGDSA